MGTETEKHRNINTRERVNRAEVKSDEAGTFQLVDLGCLVVNRKLGLSEGSEAGSVGLEKLLEDFASFFNDDLSRGAR